ncbi:c-type cytochrome [Rhodosalinus sp.]|uniref:c-type cytochrome n=1 Tax=Rhodosalinus sp. TaxID=2047741 RepID=UPI00397C81ED
MSRHAALVFLGLAAAGCAAVTAMPEPPEGRALYTDYCAACHGPTGKGDGPLASEGGLRPADLTRIAARNGGAFPRVEVLSTIDGYTKGRAEGPDMPEFGELLMGETVPVDTADGRPSPVPRPLAALMVYLESIQEVPS